MEIRTLIRTANVGTTEFSLANKAICDLMQMLIVACRNKEFPEDSTLTLEAENNSRPAVGSFASQLLVRFVCQRGSYVVRVYNCFFTDEDVAPIFLIEGIQGMATPEQIFGAIFQQALSK